MMVDAEKKNFWLMINTCMELTNHPKLSKEAIIVWWNILAKYDYDVVESALNKWVNTTSKAPMPNDILNLCKPVTPIYKALERKADKESNKRHADEVVKFVAENVNDKKDYRQWARKLKARYDAGEKLSLIQIRYFQEALAIKTMAANV